MSDSVSTIKILKMNHRKIVTCMIEKDDQLLFGRKARGVGPYPDTWHLIGGGIEQDESIEEAARREILEEAGIEVGPIVMVGHDTDTEANKHGEPTRYHFTLIKTSWKSGKLTPADDIVELRWFSKTDLSSLDLNRPTKKYFRQIGSIK